MIGPGLPNPMMWGESDPLDSIAKISRSVRLRGSAGAYLSRTASATGSQKKWSFRICMKRGALGVNAGIFCAQQGVGNRFDIAFNSSDKLLIYQLVGSSTVQINLTSVRVFRDVSAHYDFNIRCDTDSGGIVVEVNGEPITMTGTQPAAGLLTFVNGPFTHYIGISPAFSATTLDAYISFVSLIDGASQNAAGYGQFHQATSQWRPKSKEVVKQLADSGGVNSFFLPFDEIAGLANLSADASSKGNNWATTNVSLAAGVTYDSMLDTPTNVFSVLNQVDKISVAISNGGLTCSAGSSIESQFVRASMAVPVSGRWYWEQEVSSGSGAAAGVLLSSVQLLTGGFATYQNSIDYKSDGYKNVNGTETPFGAAYSAGDVIGVGVDSDAGKIYFYRNNVLQGDISFSPSGGYSPSVRSWSSTVVNVNFGQRPFVYAPPAGFKRLCTKELPVRHAVMRGNSAFVAVTDSGSSVAISLAAKAPWPNWIRIYKRRDASEGWRWQFSDDQGNYLDSSSTAAKAALPALAGASYVGYALKVAAANGITSGRLTHVNGLADVVVDGLSSARKMVMLRSEAGGNWFVYHPDLAAGKLVYLNTTASEATDATISSVTASGFTVAAALASGTYRWIALAEVDGFLKLNKYTGNGVADGPFYQTGCSDSLLAIKRTDAGATQDWVVADTTRSPANPAGQVSYFNSAAAESAYPYLDIVSNGVKVRSTSANLATNGSGATHVCLNIAAFPFRYANAR